MAESLLPRSGFKNHGVPTAWQDEAPPPPDYRNSLNTKKEARCYSKNTFCGKPFSLQNHEFQAKPSVSQVVCHTGYWALESAD